jgi:hypothetical protein
MYYYIISHLIAFVTFKSVYSNFLHHFIIINARYLEINHSSKIWPIICQESHLCFNGFEYFDKVKLITYYKLLHFNFLNVFFCVCFSTSYLCYCQWITYLSQLPVSNKMLVSFYISNMAGTNQSGLTKNPYLTENQCSPTLRFSPSVLHWATYS